MRNTTIPMEWLIYIDYTKKKIAFKINYQPMENQISITGVYNYCGKWLEITNIKYKINKWIDKHINNDKCELMNITKESIAELLLLESQKLKDKIIEFKNLSQILDKDFDIIEIDMGELTIPEEKEPVLKNVTDINDLYEKLF